MPRFNDILQTFQNGEVSPRMYGRTDFDSYKRSCRALLNMVALPQGGAARRIGSQWLTNEMSDGNELVAFNEKARLIPFVVSESEAYVIIFTGNLVEDLAPFPDIPFVPYVIIYNVSEDKFLTVRQSVIFPAFDSTGYETQFTNEDILKNLQFVQTGDTMILTEGRIPSQVIQRTDVNTFTWGPYSQFAGLDSDIPGLTLATDNLSGWAMRSPNTNPNHTLDASATTGSITITSNIAFFDPLHVGAFIAFQDAGTVGYAVITAYTSSLVVDAAVMLTLPADATSATDQWIEGAWSRYRGFPRTVTLWNGRLFFGGNAAEPDTIWASQTYDIFEMTNLTVLDPGATQVDSDPQTFTVSSDRANYITWMSGGKSDLLVGTRGREYSIKSFTASNIDVRPQTGYGSEYIQPVIVDDVPIYVQRGFRKLREILFDDRTAGYLSPEVTYLAEHISRVSQTIYTDALSPKIKGLTYQVLDNNILWAWDNNGYLYGCTKSRENSVTAFHRHQLGGSFDEDPPKVLSAVSVPNKDGTTDELYMMVMRYVNTNLVISFEKLGPDFYEDSLDEEVSVRSRIPVFSDYATIIRTHEGANFFAKLKSSVTADEAGGSTTGTVTGTVTFPNNKALIAAGSTSYISYDGTSNVDFAQTGCIRWTWYPKNPDTWVDQCMITVCTAHGDNDNLIEVTVDDEMNVILTILSSTGTNIINAVNLGQVWDGMNGQLNPYHFELNYDLTVGETRLFVNGQQLGDTQFATGTRASGAIDLLRVGAKFDGTLPAQDAMVSDVVVFDEVQHTEDFDYFAYHKKQAAISHLDYLEAETVQVVADGNYIGDYVVASGSITVDDEYDTLVIGKSYRNLLETQGFEAGSGVGSAQGEKKRLDRVVLRFNASSQAKVGRDLDNLEQIMFREPTAPPSDPIGLFTGDKEVYFDGDYDLNSRVFVVGDDPLPMQLTCLIGRGITYD